MNRSDQTIWTSDVDRLNRRAFVRSSFGLGSVALSSLLSEEVGARSYGIGNGGLHHKPTAKRVIFLHQSGAPSQMDLFDPKSDLEAKWHGKEIPDFIRKGQRLTGMTKDQESLPVTASFFEFMPHGESGMEVSELLPHTAKVVDRLCMIRSMYTHAINHDPAITYIQTGSEQPGRPSMGAWLSYGLGSEADDLPAYCVMISGGQPGDQPLMGRLWGSGFLPTHHQGIKFRAGTDPVLYLTNPPGINQQRRRQMLDSLKQLNQIRSKTTQDPEIETRIKQFELAFRMQSALPELNDVSDEPQHVFELYGEQSRQPGSYAANCLMARRLVERGVRFVQLYHRGWDHHLNLPGRIKGKCQQTDQPSAALLTDLAQRGLLNDTIVVWTGEFGRTIYCQGKLTNDDYGRDHHPRCFTSWVAGGGFKEGLVYGKTDDFSYNIDENPVHIFDLQATMLHALGIDHERLIYRYQGRDHRLTDIGGRVVSSLLR
ncbi:MAG: DUF1501 domain-containing protein [Pirellulales bacterium]|nr:DUF1501 domain-containing protein [Pirellulales bacterium]